MKKAFALSLIVLFVAAVAAAHAGDAPEIGKVVQDQTLKTMDGKSAKLSDYRNDKEGKGGKVVVLTFWSYKCPTGNRMMELNKELSDYCEKNDVVFLAVSSYGETKKEVKKYCRDEKVEYSVAYDDDFSVTKGLKADFVSTTAILDKDGKLAYYGALVSRKKDKKTGEKISHAMDAVKELVAGKEVSTPKTDTYG